MHNPYQGFKWIPDDRIIPVLLKQIDQEITNTQNVAWEALSLRWSSPVIIRPIYKRFMQADPESESFNQEAFALRYFSLSTEYNKEAVKPVRFPSARNDRSPSTNKSEDKIDPDFLDQEIQRLSAEIEAYILPARPGEPRKWYLHGSNNKTLEDPLLSVGATNSGTTIYDTASEFTIGDIANASVLSGTVSGVNYTGPIDAIRYSNA